MLARILLLVPVAGAVATADADRWLSTDRIALGVATGGSLVNGIVQLGLLWDPDGPEGPLPTGGDWLTQGDAFDVWSVAYTGASGDVTLVQGNPWTWVGTDLLLAWDGPYDSGDVTWLHGAASDGDLAVESWIEVPWGRDVAWLTIRLEALADLTDVAVAHVADPDPDAWITGAYGTRNTAGPGYAVAEGAADQRALAIAATGGMGGICTWCTTPAEVAAGSTGTMSGDLQIGIGVEVGDLATGDGATVVFALGLALGSDAAVALAEDAAGDDDHDGDGETASAGDCDDRDAGVHGGAPEVQDGLDNDCDGTVDEGSPRSDDDGDGYTEAEGDCDDGDPAVHPGAGPVEGVTDADCDGLVDTGDWPPALDTGEPPAEASGGCGCGRTPCRPATGGWIAVLLALAARRRSP